MSNKNETEGMLHRRAFICQTVMAGCLLGVAGKSKGASQSKASSKSPAVDPSTLATSCGLYCGACDIYQKRIGQAGNQLNEVLDAYEFSTWINQVPGFENYPQFKQVLDLLIQFFGECLGCRQGGGDPACKIRICCNEKAYQSCAECAEFPCENSKLVVESHPSVEGNIQTIKKDGLGKWAKAQQKKVDEGYRSILEKVKKSE